MKSTQITIKDNKEALARLSDFEKMGHELYHFNGATWYIKAGVDCVIVMDTANSSNITLDIGSREWSKSYLESTIGGYDFADSIRAYREAIADKVECDIEDIPFT